MPLARGDELRSCVVDERGSRSKVPEARGLLDGKVAEARGEGWLPFLVSIMVVLPLGGLMTPDSLSLGRLLGDGLLLLLLPPGLSLLNAFLREDMASWGV